MSKIKGKFKFKEGKLDFTCQTNAPFSEVKEALLALKKEVQRQLDNEDKCPFKTKTKMYNYKGSVIGHRLSDNNLFISGAHIGKAYDSPYGPIIFEVRDKMKGLI